MYESAGNSHQTKTMHMQLPTTCRTPKGFEQQWEKGLERLTFCS